VTQYTISTNIITDSVYQFAVKAVNVIGSSDLSSEIAIRAAQAPDAPAAPVKQSSTLTSITIQWSAPAYNGGSAVTGYRVYMDDGQGGSLTSQGTTDSDTLEFTVSDLTNSYLYYFTVSAENLVNEGQQSD
jgi:titin